LRHGGMIGMKRKERYDDSDDYDEDDYSEEEQKL
jgi:hypothetical protein